MPIKSLNQQTRTTAAKPKTEAQGIKIGPVLAAAGLVAIVYGYFSLFSTFSTYDDEGYLRYTVAAMFKGHALYDHIFTQYGPFYYLMQWLFYAPFGWRIDGQTVRLAALACWVGAALLGGWIVYQISGSRFASLAAFFALFRLLRFFTWGPGHPEELSSILALGLIALTCLVKDRFTATVAAIAGGLIAAAAMTKVNLAAYLAIPLFLSLTAASPRSPARKAFFAAGVVSSLLITLAIMSPQLSRGWTQAYCATVILSILASAAASANSPARLHFTLRTWVWIGLGFAAVSALAVAPFLLRGSSPQAMIYLTVLQHKDFSLKFFKATTFSWASVSWAAISLGFAALFRWQWREMCSDGLAIRLVHLTKLVLGAVVVGFSMLGTPSSEMGNHLLMLVAAWSWLILVSPQTDSDPMHFARLFLCFVSSVLLLYSFPVAGSQVLFSSTPFVLIGSICLSDAVKGLSDYGFLARRWPVGRLANDVPMAAVAVLLIYGAIHCAVVYRTLTPLGLPGTEGLRTDLSAVEQLRRTTASVQENCDSFYTMPGMLSFYMWTRQDPPSELVATDWFTLFKAEQQERVVADLSRHSRSCVIYNPELADFWGRGSNFSKLPITEYIFNNYRAASRAGEYILMVRK